MSQFTKHFNNGDKVLWRKLLIVIVLKLIIILSIWWVFMKDNRVSVDDKATEQHILSK